MADPLNTGALFFFSLTTDSSFDYSAADCWHIVDRGLDLTT